MEEEKIANRISFMLDQDTIKRFWNKVQKTDGCWLWTGTMGGSGYGQIRVGSRTDQSRKTLVASRVSWEIHYGKIPIGMKVLHKCDNPPCVNPEHLFLGSDRDNVHDAMNKNRWFCQGGGHYQKLTLEQAVQVKQLLGTGMRQIDISRALGIDKCNVQRIASGTHWAQQIKDYEKEMEVVLS
jgi:hypothetical protein